MNKEVNSEIGWRWTTQCKSHNAMCFIFIEAKITLVQYICLWWCKMVMIIHAFPKCTVQCTLKMTPSPTQQSWPCFGNLFNFRWLIEHVLSCPFVSCQAKTNVYTNPQQFKPDLANDYKVWTWALTTYVSYLELAWRPLEDHFL